MPVGPDLYLLLNKGQTVTSGNRGRYENNSELLHVVRTDVLRINTLYVDSIFEENGHEHIRHISVM